MACERAGPASCLVWESSGYLAAVSASLTRHFPLVPAQPWQSEEEGSWLREYPVTLMQFFRYLYHNVPDLASMWMSPDFLCALAATVFPSNIRPYSEMVGNGEEGVKTGISPRRGLADFVLFCSVLFGPSLKLLTKLQVHRFLLHPLHHYLVSDSPHAPSAVPEITVNSFGFLFSFTALF